MKCWTMHQSLVLHLIISIKYVECKKFVYSHIQIIKTWDIKVCKKIWYHNFITSLSLWSSYFHSQWFIMFYKILYMMIVKSHTKIWFSKIIIFFLDLINIVVYFTRRCLPVSHFILDILLYPNIKLVKV